MDLVSLAIGLCVGVVIAILIAFLLRKQIIITAPQYDFRLLVLADPDGDLIVLKDAKLLTDKIVGTEIRLQENRFVEVNVSINWVAEEHPADFVIHKNDYFGFMFVAIDNYTVVPINAKNEIKQILQDQNLIKNLTETIISLQKFKLNSYAKFFEEYKKIRDALFNDNIKKHVRSVGALCAKMPELLDIFAEGYIVAKLNLNEEDVEQKEELLGWLEDPQTVMRSFAVLVADELFKKISGGGDKNERK